MARNPWLRTPLSLSLRASTVMPDVFESESLPSSFLAAFFFLLPNQERFSSSFSTSRSSTSFLTGFDFLVNMSMTHPFYDSVWKSATHQGRRQPLPAGGGTMVRAAHPRNWAATSARLALSRPPMLIFTKGLLSAC